MKEADLTVRLFFFGSAAGVRLLAMGSRLLRNSEQTGRSGAGVVSSRLWANVLGTSVSFQGCHA